LKADLKSFYHKSSPKNKEYYELLEVNTDATPDQIKTAYRKKSLVVHPDKGGDPEAFKALTKAYNVISGKKRDIDHQEDSEAA